MGNELSQKVNSNLETKSPRRQNKSGIVVVKTKTPNSAEVDDNISKLSACPTFQPLLSTQSPESRPLNSDLVQPLDSQSCFKFCLRLQEHLEKCAEAVRFDQLALIGKIKWICDLYVDRCLIEASTDRDKEDLSGYKVLIRRKVEVDRVALAVMQRYTERQRAHAKQAENSRKLDEISANLTRLRANLDQTLTLADELNMLLPESERLENFRLF